jgi:predicted amidohydrolase
MACSAAKRRGVHKYPSLPSAAVHSAAPFLDLAAGVQKACEYIREAGRAGAHLVAFPETYLPGYPYWIWSHTSKYAAPFFAELFHNAVDLQGPESQASPTRPRRPECGWSWA